MERDPPSWTWRTEREALLRLATECYITGYHWLPPVLEAFRAQHPAVGRAHRPRTATSHSPCAPLVAGTIDLCIVTSRVKDRRITVAPLFNDELVLVVGATPSARRSSGVIDPSELLR